MLNLVLDHSLAFVIGELLLALSLGMFAIAFANTVRERHAIQVPVAKTKSPVYSIPGRLSAPRHLARRSQLIAQHPRHALSRRRHRSACAAHVCPVAST